MKVYLWAHIDGVYLLNDDLTMWGKPYFVTHPQRTNILKDRFKQGMDKTDLLFTVTDEDLQQLVSNTIVKWKPMLPFMKYADDDLYGFAENYIATTEI